MTSALLVIEGDILWRVMECHAARHSTAATRHDVAATRHGTAATRHITAHNEATYHTQQGFHTAHLRHHTSRSLMPQYQQHNTQDELASEVQHHERKHSRLPQLQTHGNFRREGVDNTMIISCSSGIGSCHAICVVEAVRLSTYHSLCCRDVQSARWVSGSFLRQQQTYQ